VRLARRGLTLTAGGLAAALAEGASAAVPPVLFAHTLQAAVSFAAGGTVSSAAISAQARALAKGALQTMTTTRLVHSIVLLLALGMAVIGAALGAGVGRDAVPGTRAQTTDTGGHGGTLDPATHPDEQDCPAPAPSPGGDPTKVRGLQLILAATKKEYARSEAVDLILTIKNNGKKEFSYTQAKLQELRGFHVIAPDGKDAERLSTPGGVQHGSAVITVPPGGTVTIKEELRAVNLPSPPGHNGCIRNEYYPMKTPGEYRLRFDLGKGTCNELVVKVLADADFGGEVKGLRARVSLAKARFEVGEAIPVSYVVRNVSKEVQTLWHSGFWPNHLILVKDADGKEPPLTAFGKQCRQAFSPGGERGKNAPVKVPAGGEDAAYEQYDLAKLYDLSRPGRYTVQYVYEEKQGGWEGRLPSNKAPFEMVATKEKTEKSGQTEYRDKLQGRWVAVELDGAGQNVPKDAREFQVLVKDDRITLDYSSGKKAFQFTLGRIMFNANTREFDLIPVGDNDQGPTRHGLCYLDGDANRFVLCFYKNDPRKRPPEFSAKVDIGLWVIRCARRIDPTKAVRVEGLEFVALVPDRVPKPPPGTSRDVDLGLLVTNVSGKPLTLRTFDVIRPRLYSTDGRSSSDSKEVGITIGRDGEPKPTQPAILAPGASWTWQPRATLSWTTDRATLVLSGPDGRGVAGAWSAGTLKEGKYHLAIEYSNSDPKHGDVALWVGKATTNKVEFEITAKQDSVKEELKKLQGAWRLAGYEEGGKVFAPGKINPNDSITFTKTTFTFKSGKRVLTGTFSIDPSKKPKWIDEASKGGLEFKGIYEVNGDRLRLFLEAPGKERPTEFKTREGTLQRMHSYEREKPIGGARAIEGDPTKIKVQDTEQAISQAIRVADVEFQVVSDAKCQTPPPGKQQFVDLGLRLTNRGEKTLLFNLFDTLKLGLKSADGTPIEYKWGRKRTSGLSSFDCRVGRLSRAVRDGGTALESRPT
jgi:uncharacterized protein (TIGR03067 family)